MVAFHRQAGALIIGRQPDLRLRAHGHAVDVARIDAHLDQQGLIFRNDLEQRLAGRDRAARGAQPDVADDAILRRADLKAPQHVLRGDDLLFDIRELDACRRDFAGDRRLKVTFDPGQRKLRARSGFFCLGLVADELAPFPRKLA